MPDTNAILKIAQDLIRFKSTADRPDEIRKCMEYIKGYFEGSGVIVREYERKGKPSLVISFNMRLKQKLILNGHIDVVSGAETQFEPHSEKGLLYGRGSSDMKVAVATMMHLMRQLAPKKPKIALMIVSDEELGGLDGTRFLVQKGYKSDFAITGETSRFNVETKHKGILRIKITAYGSSSHGSRPWLGSNAIDKLIHQYERLRQELPIATAKHKWLPSVNPTSFISASDWNVTPSKAEMNLDIRTTEEFTNTKIINILKRLKIKHTKILGGEMLLNERKNPYIRSLKRITQSVLGRKVKYIKSCGGSDTRFFTQRGIPAVNFGPIGHNHHKQNECLKISSIQPYHDILERFIKENK